MRWIGVFSCVALLLLLSSHGISGSKILGIFPMISKSHWNVGSAILKSLGEAGHEVTVIAPFTLENSTTASYRSVQLDGMVEEFIKQTPPNIMENKLIRNPWIAKLFLSTFTAPLVHFLMNHEKVKGMLADPSIQFDLVIVESFGVDALLGFGEHYNAPLISASTGLAFGPLNEMVGNPELPSYVPSPILPYIPRMTLWERLNNYLMAILEMISLNLMYYPAQSGFHRKYFPKSAKTLREVIQNDVALAFVNTHFSLSYPRPNVPNMIEIGGINIDRRSGKLPNDLQEFLDNAPNGVILFSMGSFLQASDFTPERRATLIRAFGKLKQRVIWRYNLPDSDELPKNILTKEWLPQNDILAHPNLKLFITHGGMLGTTESIYHGKPMIGIPIFGDQHLNIARAMHQGYAQKLDLDNLTEDAILAAVKELLNNPSYSQRAKEISQIYRDQPMTPKESVVYWCEYVMRHRGAKHLQVAGQNLGFFAYHGLDVLLILTIAVGLFVGLPVYLVVRFISRKRSSQTKKAKKL